MTDHLGRKSALNAQAARQKARETAAENANFLLEWHWARARGDAFLLWNGVRYSTNLEPGSLTAPRPVHGWDAILADLEAELGDEPPYEEDMGTEGPA